MEQDTIAAIATAPGEAGIAIVRMSGSESLSIADRIFQAAVKASSLPGNSFRHGHIRRRDGTGEVDEVLLLVFRAPQSYTREDVVEIQGHGGRTCARRVLRAVLDSGARLAEPGEFTKRAFLAGRIDLLQAEAVLDLIRAHSDRAATAALEQLDGALSSVFHGIYDRLIQVAANLEATLDFGDDELPASATTDTLAELDAVRQQSVELLRTWEEGRLLREGARVVIAGRPNVGKSTLLNALLGSDRAIVTPLPGTTRDIIEEEIVLDGIPVRLIDTAGLRESECQIEREGIHRARASAANADIIVLVLDASQEFDEELFTAVAAQHKGRMIVVLNKTDLGNRATGGLPSDVTVVPTCLTKCLGIDLVRDAIISKLGCDTSAPPHATISERHRQIVQVVLNELTEACTCFHSAGDEMAVLAVSHVRTALYELGKATGRIYTDELLDSVFRKFCIGK